MNVYQEIVKELKRLDASKEIVYHCSQIAFDLVAMYEQGTTIQELAKYCMNKQ